MIVPFTVASTSFFDSPPWWGIPALTASATLIGALIAFWSARASDKRKHKRDLKERIMVDTRTASIEYLDATEDFVTLVRLQDDPSQSLPAEVWIPKLSELLRKVIRVHMKFDLFAHGDVIEAGKALDNVCVRLMMATARGEETKLLLREYEKVKLSMINILRSSSDLKELAVSDLSPDEEKQMDAKVEALLNYVEEGMTENLSRKRED